MHALGKTSLLLALLSLAAPAQERKLIDADLTAWQKNGNGIWTVLKDGTLIGQRPHPTGKTPLGVPFPIDARQYGHWLGAQAWLYTNDEFDQFDLKLEYWLPIGGNSGVSIRDSSRGKQSYGPPPNKTPAHIGYEIQLLDAEKAANPAGSIYDVAPAPDGLQLKNDWNKLEIESRHDMIRVTLNGKLAAQSPGVADRPKKGPIGLQLHDAFSFVMFRNIRLRVIQ
ncbi:MAG TPA: DUF1080 domain-containing protein [Bryobacteraceae bacterium]|jgi:hypothetical protein